MKKRDLLEDPAKIGQNGSLPKICIVGDYIPEVFNALCLACYEYGIRTRTPYHQEGYPLGFDANMSYQIRKPLTVPNFHAFGCCATDIDLERYRLEMCFGIHDHWPHDGKGNREYEYHDRLVREVPVAYGKLYDLPPEDSVVKVPEFVRVHQDELMVRKMKTDWVNKNRFGRDYQLATWVPELDNFSEDAPCLQLIHQRPIQDFTADELTYVLNWDFVFRSHDLLNGWPMNMFALSHYQRLWAKRLTEELDIKFVPGCLTGDSMSLHLYGQYFIKSGLEGLLEQMDSRGWENLAWNVDKFLPPSDLPRLRRIIAAQEDYEKRTGHILANEDLLKQEGYNLDELPYPSEWDE
jgi:hypothetical protein